MFSKIISVSNQKGGVGKTTTAVTIASELALKNYKTLIIDCDPQSNSTSSFEINKLPNKTIYEVLVNQESINDSICSTSINNLYIAPSNQNLSAAEIELVDITNREMLLKNAINEIEKDYDYIIIDTPPALGILTINCLSACKWILIPLQVEYFALEGLNNLMQTIEMISNKINDQITILGIILTMFDKRNKLSFEIESEIKKYFDALLLGNIPRSIRIAEAPSHGMPIQIYDKDSPGAQAYSIITSKILEKIENMENS